MPRLRSVKDWVRQFFCGMCMGAADVIPGISGGTVAFIMGFYEDLLLSIKNIRVSWDFLFATVAGMLIAMGTLANAITYVLNHEIYRVYLYATFLGLILASILFCAKQVKAWHARYVVAMIVGAVIAYIFCSSLLEIPGKTYDVYLDKSPDWTKKIANYDEQEHLLTGVTKNELASMLARGSVTPATTVLFDGETQPVGDIVKEQKYPWIMPWTMTCGVIGITALLLPGVSGSYMLNILGMYPIVMGALAEFVNGLKGFTFDLEAFLILANLGVGVLVGALLFSRVISWFLQHYHQTTLSLLTGFLIGSLQSVWPFWSYEYVLDPLKIEAGPKLHAISPILPTGNYEVFLLVAAGFATVFVLETVANKIKTV
jgi:putative membrane protein